MTLLTDPQVWIAFLTLTALELVLGIDNIVFISIVADKLPEAQRNKARRLGLFFAMFLRILLLFTLSTIVGLTAPLFEIASTDISGRDLILLAGGLFLLWKSTTEIHHHVYGEISPQINVAAAGFASVILQIIVIDAVFSIDSIITAVGLATHFEVMVAAVVVSVVLMMLFAASIGRFVSQHPSIKMLALAFLFVIAVLLIADGLHHHVPKGYVYFAMAFSLLVEALNIRRSTLRARYEGRIKCISCPNRILPETAKRNHGLCGVCHRKAAAIKQTGTTIDGIELCYIDSFPDDLPDASFATHIGMFLSWSIKNNLVSEHHLKENPDQIALVCGEKLSGKQFLIDHCDGRLCTSDFNETGRQFAAWYYQSDLYRDDYSTALAEGLNSIFEVEDSWENYHIIEPYIDNQYRQWTARRKFWLPSQA